MKIICAICGYNCENQHHPFDFVEDENIDKINLELILISQPVKYFDWMRCKGNTPEMYEAILNAMQEACNTVINRCASNASCLFDSSTQYNANIHVITNVKNEITKW